MPARDHRFEVAVGGGDDAHVDLARASPRRRGRTSPSSRTRSSFACMREAHLANLVEEERAAVGDLEEAGVRRVARR